MYISESLNRRKNLLIYLHFIDSSEIHVILRNEEHDMLIRLSIYVRRI